jgi:hypothetical protein
LKIDISRYMGQCRFCQKKGCSDRQKGCPERTKKITIHKSVGKKANQDEIDSRLMGFLKKYSAYSLGITSNPEALSEQEQIKFNYRKMFILWKGNDPSGIAGLWGRRVKQIRNYKTYGKKLISTGPTDLETTPNQEYSLYLLVR